MLAFNFFFLPPRYTLHLSDSQNWVALAVYLVTAVVVSELAARSRRRAEEAEQRARETALLAEVAATLERALEHADKERIQACTNCGLAPLPWAVAVGKLEALGAGARLMRSKH